MIDWFMRIAMFFIFLLGTFSVLIGLAGGETLYYAVGVLLWMSVMFWRIEIVNQKMDSIMEYLEVEFE